MCTNCATKVASRNEGKYYTTNIATYLKDYARNSIHENLTHKMYFEHYARLMKNVKILIFMHIFVHIHKMYFKDKERSNSRLQNHF